MSFVLSVVCSLSCTLHDAARTISASILCLVSSQHTLPIRKASSQGEKVAASSNRDFFFFVLGLRGPGHDPVKNCPVGVLGKTPLKLPCGGPGQDPVEKLPSVM